jgi:pyruvate/2-oxoglutarate dehydrogenase complex dihydrolipoamide acyltransferase (E2) component
VAVKLNELPDDGASQGASWADSGVTTMAEAPVADQQSVWLGQGPEVVHASVQARSKQIVGMSALAVVVAGLVGATVVYFLAGASPGRTGSKQITAPTTTAPRAQPVLPSVLPSGAPMTAAAPVTTPAAPAATPAAPVTPEAPVVTPAAPPPAELAPSPPSRRPAGRTIEEHRAAVPPPHTNGRSGDEDLRQAATSQDQPPPADVSPDSPAPTSAPEGFTRVPYKPWKPPAPQ